MLNCIDNSDLLLLLIKKKFKVFNFCCHVCFQREKKVHSGFKTISQVCVLFIETLQVCIDVHDLGTNEQMSVMWIHLHCVLTLV